MRIKETIGISSPGSIESPLEDVVVLVLADGAGVALGVQSVFSARVRCIRDGDSRFIVSRCVEIPLIGSDGEVSGILCHTGPWSDMRGAAVNGGRERVTAIGDVAQFVVDDINNVLAMIGNGLRLLEGQDDEAYRKVIVGKMREAITRGALLSRQLLDAVPPRPVSIDGFVAGSRLAAIAGTLDRALHPDVTVRSEIVSDLWVFDADPEELYFTLLNLCRNSAVAMPEGGVITIAARNVQPGTAQGSVEIVVADDGVGMSEEVLSQAFTPYFTTKPAGRGSGLGLPQVQRFVEGRGGAVRIERGQGAGTLVRLSLPRVQAAGLPSSIVRTEIAYTPSPDGGEFHVIDPETAAPTS